MKLTHLSTAQVLATPVTLADPTRPTIMEALSADFHRIEIFDIELMNWFEVSPTVLGINLLDTETFFIATDASAVDVRDGVPYFNFYTDEDLSESESDPPAISGIRYFNLVEQKLL